jgi:hypothetical protein
MVNSYSGLCIDGPLDGKMLTWSQPSYRAQQLSNMPAVVYDNPRPMLAAVPLTTYTWHRGVEVGRMQVDFWLPHELDLEDAMARLVNCYVQQRRAEDAKCY